MLRSMADAEFNYACYKFSVQHERALLRSQLLCIVGVGLEKLSCKLPLRTHPPIQLQWQLNKAGEIV